MNKELLFNFVVDKENNRINIEREFDAPLDLVWAAWTEPDILDQWWAPSPWKAKTKYMDFREGGYWLYAMVSPENEEHWAKAEYLKIDILKSYKLIDGFCDSDGNLNLEMPRNKWENQFNVKGDSTVVDMVLSFDTWEDLEKIIALGFKEGFTAGLSNLDNYIKAQFYLRKSKKPNNNPRVSTYLNFPGNTEEVMNFYKSVFNTEFINGIQRLSDAPQDPNSPPLSESLKNMVLHVELPILGGHILMATDAPKEMGFEVKAGNNMHINLEPDSREETERLYYALSEGGVVEIALQDMFWGAYYGNFQDKYGVNWMIHFQQK